MRLGSLLSWHRWSGLIATLVLLVAALTSLPLVYRKPLTHWLVTPQAVLPAGYGVPAMLDELDRILERYPEARLSLIKAPNFEEPYWALRAEDGDIRLFAIDTLAAYTRNAWFIDFLEVTRELHVDLMAGLLGEWLLLLAGIIGIALGITGLFLWWPARKGLRLRWILPAKIKLPLLMQYHRHSGALTSPILIVVLLTGSLMLWSGLVFPTLSPLQVDLQPDRVVSIRTVQPSVLLERAARAIPDGWPTYIRVERPGTSEASVRFRLPGEWHPNGRTTVYFDNERGEIGVSKRADEAGLYRKLINQVYPLHSGYGMHGVYLFVVFVSGVALLWLGGTGLVSYLRRLAYR